MKMDAKNLSHSGFCAQRSFWRMHFMYFVFCWAVAFCFPCFFFRIFSLFCFPCFVSEETEEKSRPCCRIVKDRFPHTFFLSMKKKNKSRSCCHPVKDGGTMSLFAKASPVQYFFSLYSWGFYLYILSVALAVCALHSEEDMWTPENAVIYFAGLWINAFRFLSLFPTVNSVLYTQK